MTPALEPTHQDDLSEVFVLERRRKSGLDRPERLAAQVERCLSRVRARQPYGTDEATPLSLFLANHHWDSTACVRNLLAAYIDAGYIDLNSARADCLPLEAAIIVQNVSAFVSLLSMGADERMVPSPGWRGARPSEYDDQQPPSVIADVYAFIELESTGQTATGAMVAAARESEIRRQVRSIEDTMRSRIRTNQASAECREASIARRATRI